jgi:seryl-tRNA synthetase
MGLVNFEELPDYRWMENGQSVLSGNLLEVYRRLDRLFLKWAGECDAAEYRFPTFISARDLARLDYFRSFPHLVTFPVVLDEREENLKRFSEGEPLDPNGEIQLTSAAPIRDVLTPAACYHFYVQFQGEQLETPRYVTTLATCFRREAYYSPLERQWSFSMREIVCLGTADEVKEFLKRYQDRASGFFTRIGLSIEWKNATDPFFNPSRNPKYVLQKLDPVKTEMIYRTGLAIGSINFHRNYFGEAFQISRDGKEAFSGCVAFGVERWIFAFLDQFGLNESSWPDFDSWEE